MPGVRSYISMDARSLTVAFFYVFSRGWRVRRHGVCNMSMENPSARD